MAKDRFMDIFEGIEISLGTLRFKEQLIQGKNVYIESFEHLLEGWNSKTKGEKLKLEYYIAKKEDGTIDFIKVPKNIQREIQIIKDVNSKIHWKVLGLEGTPYINKEEPNKDSFILFFIPELSLEHGKLYQFVFGNFLESEYNIYNASDYDEHYSLKNPFREAHFDCNQYFAKSFEDFVVKLNQIINSGKKYYVVSTVSFEGMLAITNTKNCKKREVYAVKSKVKEFLEKSEKWFSLLDLFSGWYYKSKKKIHFGDYKSPVEYLNYLSVRSSLLEYKKTKNVNLRYLKNIMKKYYFNKELKVKQEENTQFDLIEKLSIMYNILQIFLYKTGGFAE